MAEGGITKRALVALSTAGARLFRQNTGMGWAGEAKINKYRNGKTHVEIPNARPLHAGLCTGSSDLIGWTPMTITAEHVGMQVAVFTAAEVKDGDTKTTTQQKRFLRAVAQAGGIAIILRDGDDYDCLARFPHAAVLRQLPGQGDDEF